MSSPKRLNRRSSRSSFHGFSIRGGGAAVFPLIVFSLSLFIAFAALTLDVMRVAYAAQILSYAAQSAALYAYSFATGDDGSYTTGAAQAGMTARALAAGGQGAAAWHLAPRGPDQSGSESAVTFGTDDISFVANPNQSDAGDFFLRIRAGRDGNDALKMFFLPAIYAYNSMLGLPSPAGLDRSTPFRTVEVISQPASRIGAGAPKDAPSGSRAFDLAGFAAFPLAISNQQFRNAAMPGESMIDYPIDLTASNQVPPQVEGRIRGCFVNLAVAGGGQYYGTAQGNLAIDQLNATLRYFAPGAAPQSIAPGVVERGSLIYCFDPADFAFQSRKAQIIAACASIPPNSHLIVPVLRNDPLFGQANEVVGFARLRLNSLVNQQTGEFNVSFAIEESVPVRNGSFANGARAVPEFSSSLMPPPVVPFAERAYDPASGGLERRYRGIAMAPALSPREIPEN